MCLLKEKIDELRIKLNELISQGATYEEIYKASQELDKYITEYYRWKLTEEMMDGEA